MHATLLVFPCSLFLVYHTYFKCSSDSLNGIAEKYLTRVATGVEGRLEKTKKATKIIFRTSRFSYSSSGFVATIESRFIPLARLCQVFWVYGHFINRLPFTYSDIVTQHLALC